MKKAVIQSYIGTIPEWREECINTVKHWCKNNDIDYVWYDTPSGIIEARFGLKEVPHVSFQKFEWIEATKGYDSLMWVDTDIVVQGNPQFEWESEFTIENRLRNFEGVTISHPQGGLFYGTRLFFRPLAAKQSSVFKRSQYRTIWYSSCHCRSSQ